MNRMVTTGALLLAGSLIAASQPANAGLGESSSPQRFRCENEASTKFSMWNWFSRRDFVQRCVASGGKSNSRRKNMSSR